MSVILASAGYDHTIRFWEALTGVCSRTITHTDAQVNRLSISPDKRILAAASHPHTRIYDLTTTNPNPIASLEGHKNNVTSVQFSNDARWLATSSEDATVKIWDTRSPTPTRTYVHSSPVNEVVIHPNQGELISCDRDGNIKIWDLAEGTCVNQLNPDSDISIQSLSMASDGSLLVAANTKGNVFVWQLTNGFDTSTIKSSKVINAHDTYITKVLLSSDSKHIATCSADHMAKIWSVDNNFNCETILEGHQRWVWDCAFSADSAYLVTASSDHYVRLWDLSTREIVRQYGGHQKGAICVALNDV